MKILILAPHPFFQNRGTPIALRMLLETLSAAGHKLTVLVYAEGEDISIEGCKIIRIKKPPFVSNINPGFSWKKLVCDAYLYRTAKRLLELEEFDLIHAGEEAVFMARRLGRIHSTPYVYDMDSSLPQQMCEKLPFLSPLLPFLQRFEKNSVADSQGVLAVCKYLEDLARSYDSSVVVQRLEDVTLLAKDISAEKSQQTDLGLESGTVTFMYVGNLEKYQGIDLLLEGFSLACLEIDKIRLVVIGGNRGDIRKYKRKAKQLGIRAGRVIFAGPKPVDDLACYLAQADVLVSPRTKGYNTPMKIYSYLDSGRPVLATRLLTHTQVLDDSISWLVDADGSSMAVGISRLAEDEQLRNELAENAAQRVAEEYTREAFNQKLLGFYSQIGRKTGDIQ